MSSDRIARAFDAGRLRAAGRRAAFVSYSCAGDPDFETSVEIFRRLIEAGVDVLEVGVPFSDPLADGPTNQRAAERALAAGMTAGRVFDLVRRIRGFSDSVPIVFYTYYNLVFALGHDEYLRRAKEAGVDAMLVLDLPPEESADYRKACDSRGMRTVYIVAPTTPRSRIPTITGAATGFIYYVSREGVTGERADRAEGVEEALAAIRRETDLPVVVGFGISNPGQVRATAETASGVVVGSAIVRRCADLRAGKETRGDWAGFSRFLGEMVGGCAAG
ncbi:MAG: tryptophan synthase subunit alpha [Puniceicoccaceae bacterium]